MLYQVHAKAIDSHGDTVTESTFPPCTMAEMTAYQEEFIDRLARRGVPFARVIMDMAVSLPVRSRGPIRPLFSPAH